MLNERMTKNSFNPFRVVGTAIGAGLGFSIEWLRDQKIIADYWQPLSDHICGYAPQAGISLDTQYQYFNCLSGVDYFVGIIAGSIIGYILWIVGRAIYNEL